MGNPGKPKIASSIQHFSHQHQLQLLNTTANPSLNSISCVGCKLQPSEWVYACKPCNFILDISCSQMPQQANHPADRNHTLSLLVKPAYSSGIFRCDACGDDGDGFNYNCSTCGIDIHIVCATMPVSLTHQTHPHPLNLAFSQGFSCDICSRDGSNNLVYLCSPCDFVAHLNCATNKPSSSLSAPSVSQQDVIATRSTAIATEEAKQNFIQKFEAAQKVDKEWMLSMIQGFINGGNDLTELQNYFRSGNSATGVVTQEYVQSLLGGHRGAGDGVPEQIDPDYVQNSLGDNSGDSGDDQQEEEEEEEENDDEDEEETLEALTVRLKIEARGRQAALDLWDDHTYVRRSYRF